MVTVAARRVPMPGNLGLLVAKLFALAAMVLDHVDWLLLDGSIGFHDTWGRLVFPVFAYVLALNLTRAGEPVRLFRVAGRMAGWGGAASFLYAPLAGWYPLNVLFTLAAGVAVVACLRCGWWVAAGAGFVAAGLLVDYQWFGLACIVGAWWALQQRVAPSVIVAGMAVLLMPINGSLWGLLALPVVLAMYVVDGDGPRWKWLFYGVYVGHLGVLAIIASAM